MLHLHYEVNWINGMSSSTFRPACVVDIKIRKSSQGLRFLGSSLFIREQRSVMHLLPKPPMRPQTINKLTVQRKKRMSNSNKNVKENRRETKTRIIEISSDIVPQTYRTLCREQNNNHARKGQSSFMTPSYSQERPHQDHGKIQGSEFSVQSRPRLSNVWVNYEPCIGWWSHKCIMEPKNMFSDTNTHSCVTLPYSVPDSEWHTVQICSPVAAG